MRGYFFTGVLGLTLSLAGSASSASWSDKLTFGEAAPQGASLVAGPRGANYELRGGAKLEFSEGAEFGFDPSVHIKLRKPSDPETITRAIHLIHGRVDVTVPTLRDPTAVMVRGPGKLSVVAKEGRLTFIADADQHVSHARRCGRTTPASGTCGPAQSTPAAASRRHPGRPGWCARARWC